MLKLLLLATITGLTSGVTVLPVLDHCAVTKDASTIDEVDLASQRIFIYLKRGQDTGDAVVMVKKGSKVKLRIATDCAKGTAKVSRKVTATWTNIAKDFPIKCSDEMLFVLNSYRGELWIGEGPALKYKSIITGSGQLTVTGDVTVIQMAVGKGCILYPKEIETCPQALAWFKEACDDTGTASKGYFNCWAMPRCQGNLFDPVQQLDMFWFGCSTSDGLLVPTMQYVSDDLDKAKQICSQK